MGYKDFIYNIIPPSYNTDGEVFQALMGAIGSALDKYDPEIIGLQAEFSVTKATAYSLNKQGADWGRFRKANESDTAFRQRVLSLLPLYVNGPSNPGIRAVINPFTGADPIIFEYGPGAFTMDESAIGEAGFSAGISDTFTFELFVQNPDGLSYDHQDMENAIEGIKMARSSAIIYHNGVDTSPLGEQPNETVTIV